MSALNPIDVIRHKRDGLTLNPGEIDGFIAGAVRGAIPEYQATALLMAIYFQGMNPEETTALTKAMIQSGRQVRFADDRPKVDKHSTGGVGDKVSLILAPLVAALGVDVPMVSGRGLGHTGGTLDKLESIPGFRVHLLLEEFTHLVANHGLAMMGQTEDFVPADKLLYALRDVTATVECIPLITASILSKKVAEGISALVLDIKVGSGAFMKTQRDAEKLARSLVTVGRRLGLRIRAVLTDMNQPLGYAIGHSLEVLECLEVLEGKGPSDLREVTIELASHMLVLGERSSSLSAARVMARKALQDGKAREKFREMCRAQGATIDVLEKPQALALGPNTFEVPAPRSGYVSRIDGEQLGLAVVELGGGRIKATDAIDYGVGLRLRAKIGTAVRTGQPLATVYYEPGHLSRAGRETAEMGRWIAGAFSIGAQKTKAPDLVKKVIE